MEPLAYETAQHVLNPEVIVPGPGDGQTPVAPLPPNLRPEWNKFIDFVEAKGMKGNKLLDDRNTALGKQLMQEYLKTNPKSPLTYDVIPSVQQSLQEYRAKSLQEIRSGKAQFDGKEEEFMPGLSKVDGWLGSKTSSYKFPSASSVVKKDINGLTGEDSKNNHTTEVKNFGTDVELYDKMMNAVASKKAKQ